MKILIALGLLPLLGLSLEGQTELKTFPKLRVDSALYVGNSTTAASKNVTLFHDDHVFDFSYDATGKKLLQVAILNSNDNGFQLLNVEKRVRLEISRSRLLQLTAALKAEINQNPLTKFLTNIKFEENDDPVSGWTTLDDGVIKYRYKAKKLRNPRVVVAYQKFLENYTLLSVTTPGGSPPFARMKLNDTLRKHGVVPSEIQLEIRRAGDMKKTAQARSRHTFIEQLSDSDLRNIEKAKKMVEDFSAVSLSDFSGVASTADSGSTLGKKNK